MDKHRQAVIPILAALAAAGLLGGCAVASSGQPTGSGPGSASAARCAGSGGRAPAAGLRRHGLRRG